MSTGHKEEAFFESGVIRSQDVSGKGFDEGDDVWGLEVLLNFYTGVRWVLHGILQDHPSQTSMNPT